MLGKRLQYCFFTSEQGGNILFLKFEYQSEGRAHKHWRDREQRLTTWPPPLQVKPTGPSSPYEAITD